MRSLGLRVLYAGTGYWIALSLGWVVTGQDALVETLNGLPVVLLVSIWSFAAPVALILAALAELPARQSVLAGSARQSIE